MRRVLKYILVPPFVPTPPKDTIMQECDQELDSNKCFMTTLTTNALL